MNIINRVVMLSFLSVAMSSYAAQQLLVRSIKPSQLKDVRNGIFYNKNKLLLSGVGGTVSYDTQTGEEKEISKKIYARFVGRKNRIAAVSTDKLMIYDTCTGKMHEESWPLIHVALAFNDSDELFACNTGHILKISNSHMVAEHDDGKTLIGINCNCVNYAKNFYKIDCDSTSLSTPSLIFDPLKNEILYSSSKKILSRISVENGKVHQKGCISIENVMGGICSNAILSQDSSYLAVSSTTSFSSGLELFVHDVAKQQSDYYGNSNGIAFHNSMLAILRRNTAIDCWDVKTKKRLYSTNPIIEGQDLPCNCNHTVEFSPDGQELLVVIPEGKHLCSAIDKAFLVSMEAAVRKYNELKAEKK